MTAPEFHTAPPRAVPAVPDAAFPPAPRALPCPPRAHPATESPPSPPLFELTLRNVGVPKLSAALMMLPPSTEPLLPVRAFPPSVFASYVRFVRPLYAMWLDARGGGVTRGSEREHTQLRRRPRLLMIPRQSSLQR